MRFFGWKPDVMASMKTVPNVEILHAGIEYQLQSGPTTFTPEDLRDAVMAANEDHSIPSPRLAIGHIDPRFNGPEFDGTPAFGKAMNLRLSENGMAVYADYVGVPGWLADIMPTAYPSRSIEGYWNVESVAGKKWRFVISSCKLLGVKWPGVSVLEDLPQFYGDEIPNGVVLDESLVAAARQQPGGNPMKTKASANLDDVRRAFYNDFLGEHPESYWWWIQAVLMEPNQLVVEDDESHRLFMIPFSADEGKISFGEAEPVRIDYIPDTREANKAAASHVAATLVIGRKVEASWPTRAASRPDNTGGAMDPKEVRKQLGLAEDASEDQVTQALLVKAGLVQETPPEEPAAPVVELPVAPVIPAPVAVEEPAAVAAALTLPPGTVLVEKDAWAAVQEGAKTATELKAKQDKAERNSLVSAAIAEGRIPPARKEHWEKYLESDPEGGAATLAALEPNIVPLRERGHGQTAEGASETLEAEAVAGWSEQLFPEVRSQNQRDRVAAETGLSNRQRILSDAHYGRR